MQYSLRSLLLAFVLLALLLSVFGRLAAILWPILLVVLAYGRSRAYRRVRVINAFLFLLLLSPLVLPILDRVNSRPRNPFTCVTNLTQIHWAFSFYQDECARLPPVRHLDAHGRPLLSWRVILAPGIIGPHIASRVYRISEPWDSDENRKRALIMPREYACPDTRFDAPGLTTYLAVTGSGGDWLAAEEPHCNPVRVIEACHTPTPWMQPRDVSFEEVCAAAGSSKPILAGEHVGPDHFFYRQLPHANALFVDGTIRQIPNNLPPDVLRAVLRGERAALAKLDDYRRRNCRVNWPNCLALAMLVVCTVTMLLWPLRERKQGNPQITQMAADSGD
jgi:hypothetical protein